MVDRPKAALPRGGALAERSLMDLMKTAEVGQRFERYAPNPELGKAIHTSALLTLQRDWEVYQHANPLEVMQRMFGYARIGLEINTPRQYAHLIAFKSQGGVTIEQIIGYRGYLHLSRESGQLVDIGGKIVTQQELDMGLFDYEFGTEPFLKHKLGPDRSSPRIYAYGVALLKGDVFKFDVLPWDDINRIRDGSSGYQFAKGKGPNSSTYQKNPWVAHSDEMGIKTVFRRMSKTLDISGRFDMAVALEEASERGEKHFGAILDLDPNEWKIAGLEEEAERQEEERRSSEKPPAETSPQRTAPPPQQEPPPPDAPLKNGADQRRAQAKKKDAAAEKPPAEASAAGDKPAEAQPPKEPERPKAAPPRDEPPPPDNYWGD